MFQVGQPCEQGAEENARIVTHHVHYFKISGRDECLAEFFDADADGQEQAAEQQIEAKDVYPPLFQGVIKQKGKQYHQTEMDDFVAIRNGSDGVLGEQPQWGLEANNGDEEQEYANG